MQDIYFRVFSGKTVASCPPVASASLRAGSGAMAASMAGNSTFWKDDEIVVDRDGIPHYTGSRPELMREYRRRVLFAFSTLEGEGDSEEKERRDLEKKQKKIRKEAFGCFARRSLALLPGFDP